MKSNTMDLIKRPRGSKDKSIKPGMRIVFDYKTETFQARHRVGKDHECIGIVTADESGSMHTI